MVGNKKLKIFSKYVYFLLFYRNHLWKVCSFFTGVILIRIYFSNTIWRPFVTQIKMTSFCACIRCVHVTTRTQRTSVMCAILAPEVPSSAAFTAHGSVPLSLEGRILLSCGDLGQLCNDTDSWILNCSSMQLHLCISPTTCPNSKWDFLFFGNFPCVSFHRGEISLFYIHLVVKFLNMVEYSTPVEGIYLRHLPQSEVSTAV